MIVSTSTFDDDDALLLVAFNAVFNVFASPAALHLAPSIFHLARPHAAHLSCASTLPRPRRDLQLMQLACAICVALPADPNCQ